MNTSCAVVPSLVCDGQTFKNLYWRLARLNRQIYNGPLFIKVEEAKHKAKKQEWSFHSFTEDVPIILVTSTPYRATMDPIAAAIAISMSSQASASSSAIAKKQAVSSVVVPFDVETSKAAAD